MRLKNTQKSAKNKFWLRGCAMLVSILEANQCETGLAVAGGVCGIRVINENLFVIAKSVSVGIG
jgi:hypothetical protein